MMSISIIVLNDAAKIKSMKLELIDHDKSALWYEVNVEFMYDDNAPAFEDQLAQFFGEVANKFTGN